MIQMEENGMEVDWSTLDEDEVVFPYEIQEACQIVPNLEGFLYFVRKDYILRI